jgi:hypothetical protein
MYTHPNLSQIKFLADLLAGCQGEQILRTFSENFKFPGDPRLGPDIPGL